MPTDQTDLGNPSFETASQRSLGSVMLTVKAARTLVHTYNLSICVRNSASFQLHSYTESLRTLRLCQKKKNQKEKSSAKGLWAVDTAYPSVPCPWDLALPTLLGAVRQGCGVGVSSAVLASLLLTCSRN